MTAERRKRALIDRAMSSFAASKPGGWYYINVAGKIDPYILRWTKGRVSVSPGYPVLLLRHKGAKSGALRETALLFAADGPRIVLVASKAGSPKSPAWYHNLRANPDVEVLAPGGRTGRYRAREAQGEERDRLWALANDLYPGYNVYQTRTGGRAIPVMVLERSGA